jgi:hypothetical protein
VYFELHLPVDRLQLTVIIWKTQNTSFLSLVNFGAAFAGGALEAGAAANASVEVRFGPGRSQMAHRFMVPVGATSGVPDANYSYADYVTVPFEVWDITNNQQLMVSFRDQDRNGAVQPVAQQYNWCCH